MMQVCKSFDCPLFMGKFESDEKSEYCPECAARIRKHHQEHVGFRDQSDWIPLSGTAGSAWQRKTHKSGG